MASESGRAQTSFRAGVIGHLTREESYIIVELPGKVDKRGWQSRIRNDVNSRVDPEYGEARGTLSELAGTIP